MSARGVPVTYVTSTDGYYPEFRSRPATHMAYSRSLDGARSRVIEAARRYRETQEQALPFETQQAAFVEMSNALAALDALEAQDDTGFEARP